MYRHNHDEVRDRKVSAFLVFAGSVSSCVSFTLEMSPCDNLFTKQKCLNAEHEGSREETEE